MAISSDDPSVATEASSAVDTVVNRLKNSAYGGEERAVGGRDARVAIDRCAILIRQQSVQQCLTRRITWRSQTDHCGCMG
ncbi:hypothetical protein BVI1335_990035 [Burkholderia vietnamiensis]|nr:hypothetical protein BVI1335_990035 [Burkholderia vietnamiensis]